MNNKYNELPYTEKLNSKEEQKETFITQLMNDYAQDIIWLIYSYVKDKNIAEDLTQEVFIKAFKKLDGFQGNSSIKTWLYKIAINCSKDYLKSAYIRRVLPINIFCKFNNHTTPSTESIYMKHNESAIITKNVLKLPLKYREVIMLFYFEELSINEIEKIIHVNSNTIKTRLRKAKQLLKGALENEEGGKKNG
ncbi:sigma-70 family RNA polymerase sigma factor [Lysinibacillus sp. NPDC097231]|uniref:sigma-70 family RNA polymerase sigma factor n=1 Tax=Lysinibacillus sp. NPDC097231 TaxID=3364142 RepID=UPI00382453E6